MPARRTTRMKGLRPGRPRGSSGRSAGPIPAGTWVELECVILRAEERAPRIPEDTASHSFAGRVRGFLVTDAEEGAEAQVRTRADRVVTGNLRVALPRDTPDFGDPVPELLLAGEEMRARLHRGSRS